MADTETGIAWLATQQNADGSYGNSPTSLATPVQSTAEVLRAHLALTQVFSVGFDSALGYLNEHPQSNTEFLARKIVVNAENGTMVHGWVNALLTHQNPDGGFGDRPGYGSSVFDTAFAVEALASANYLTLPQASSAVAFLMAHQQSNGSWADGGNSSSIHLTAMSMRALWPYRFTFAGVTESLTDAQNFLLSRRGANGLWGEDFLSALALLALVPNVGDLSVVNDSAAGLRSHQLANGSWAEDSYTTALALQALRAYDARQSGSTPEASGTISGYVVRANSTEPIAGATITVSQVPGVAVLTNGEGYYVIPGLPPGRYTVAAEKAGYTSASVVVTTEANQVTVAGELVLELIPQTGLVRGRVFDAATGQPLLAVQVSLSGAMSYSVLTNSAGEFDFGPVEPGGYGIRFEKAGYLTLTGTATVVAGRVVSTQLGMTLAGGYVDDTPGIVSGRVVNARTGQEIAGAVFNLGGGLSATTGADGAFSVAAVPRGTYQGTLSASGYQTGTFNLVFAPGASGDVGTLSLYPEAVTTPPPTSLTLRGLVEDGVSGAPIAGAMVVLTETGESVIAGADGRFVLSGITVKSFNLAVQAGGYLPMTYAIQVSAFGEIEVALKLSPPGNGASTSQLAGVVTDIETGAAIAGAQVSIAGTSWSATTGGDGSFRLEGIDRLEFTVNVSAVGYVQRSLGVRLGAHGSYPLSPELQPVPGESFQVVAVSARQSEYGANATALFTTRIASLLSSSKPVLVLGEIQDATGATVATVQPYAEGTTVPASQFVFAAGELKELTVPWDTAQFAPGPYRLVVRVSEPGTISRVAPFGEVLAENAARTSIVPTLAINGAMAINPPLTQAGLPTPVSFTALVRNAGNVPLPASVYVLTVRSASTGATLFTTEASGEALAVGVNTQVAFGTWVPSEPGNLPVSVRPKEAGVAGALADRLYVGDKASGTFTVDRTVVPEGNQTVRGRIRMQGVDTSQGGSTDPLFALVKESVRRAGVYTATNAVAWHNNNQCLGCHIQTQSLLGLSSAAPKAEIDAKATRYLYNTVATSQWADGVLRISNPGESKTQTALGLWSLSASAGMAGNFRTQYKAAQYLYSQRVRNGDRSSWSPDHASGWWNSSLAQSALVVKGFADVLESANQLPAAGATDYKLGASRSLGTTRRSISDLAAGPDGYLYVVLNSDGVILKLNPETGAVTVAASGLGSIIAVAVAEDGTLYVTRYGLASAVIKIKPNGTRVNMAVGGNITDAAFGPDGWLYLSDFSNHRILRVNAADQVEVYISGGLLKHPNSLEFDADGNLLVANQNGYDILKVAAADRGVTRFADGLAARPMRMMRGGDGSIYVTTMYPDGLIRVRPDGSGERVLQTSQDLEGVAALGGKLYVADLTNYAVHELQFDTLNTDGLAALSAELPYAARYLLANTEGDNDNTVHALRLIGLAEAASVLTDAALLAQIQAKVTAEATVLRSRQRADGGWSRYTYVNTSDPLATAMVGIALEYTNPSRTDPQIRNAIQFLLNKQRADGSWDNFTNGLSTRLASTSFVMVFMPKALERLGGIDIDLHVELPSSIQLSNASTAPTVSEPGADGSMKHLWKLPGVTGAGREVSFDLGLLDMALGEQRPAATRAYLEFKNSFVDEAVRLPLTVPVVSVTSGMTLAVATDKAHYLANEPMTLTSTVRNTSQVATSGQVVLVIRAAGSTEPIVVLPPLQFTGLAAGAELPLMATWNTGATLAGDYQVYARVLDTQGRSLASALAPFDISAPGVVASTAVAADKPGYDAWDAVYLTGYVRNVAPNTALAPSRVELTVETPAGETLYTATRNLTQLPPGGRLSLPFSFRLQDAVSGTYPVTLVLKDEFTREVLSTSTTSFQVVRRALQSLAGTVAVEFPSVHVGDPNACTDRARTVSASTAAGVTLIHRLIKVDSGEVVDESTETVDLPGGGQEHVSTRGFSTAGFELGGYACVLQAQLDGELHTLASAGFRVVEPPIQIAAALALGGKGRLLVLLDAAALGADPHGPEIAPELAAQRTFLEQLLTNAGWSYTITESADDFARELRTGGYAAYALFSEQAKLSQQTQKELREAIFRGEGLVVAGAHDSRNHGQYEVLGVKFNGHLSDVTGVRLSSAEFPLLSGEFDVLTQEHPERIDRLQATRLGIYHSSGTRGLDAVALNTYGSGEAAFAGADLLAIATRDGQSSVAADLLRILLERVHPANLATGPGSVVPVQLTVANQGIAVPVTATVTLPDGVSVIDPGAGAISGQGITFVFPLAVDEVRTVRFWVKLPEVSGAVTLQAVVSAGGGNQTISVSAEVVLPVASVEQLGSIKHQLDALVDAGHPHAQALRRASTSLGKALESSNPALAITEVLKAADALVGLSEPNVADLRVALGVWLRVALQSVD